MKYWQSKFTNFVTRLRDDSEYRGSALRGGGFLLLVVSLLLVAWMSQSRPSSETLSLFDTRELTADEIGSLQIAFAQESLNEYEIRGNQIMVERDQRSQFLSAAFMHHAIPPDLQIREPASAIDLLKNRSQQRQSDMESKRRRIRDLVLQFRFVANARVEYDEAHSRHMFGDTQKTASVTIQPSDRRHLEDYEIQAIVDTVKGAVAGIRAEDIVIIDTNANRSFTGSRIQWQRDDHVEMRRKRYEEARFERKICDSISAYPGARVNVRVTFDPVPTATENLPEDPAQTKPHANTNASIDTSMRIPRPDPANGTADQQPGLNQGATVVPGPQGNTGASCPAGCPLVSVSIGVPESLVRRFSQRSAVPLPGVEQVADNASTEPGLEVTFEQIRQDIQRKVQPLLPYVQSIEEQVVVTLDPELPAVADTATTPATESSTLGFWAQHWKTVALIGFGFAALIVLSIRTASPPSVPTDETFLTPIDPSAMETVSLEDAHRSEQNEQLRLKNEIEQWCLTNPDEAVATIRGWLEKAG